MTRALAVALAAVSVGWLDPWGKAREAARLYAAGKYDDAVARYNEALTDRPDSPLLHFNLGDAAYRQGKYTAAVNAFQQVPTSDADPARAARVAYNVGNAKYRLAAAAEASAPQTALGLYAEALAAYRRALGAAPDLDDAKFNHELVTKKIADLKKKLEEEQKPKDTQPPQDERQPPRATAQNDASSQQEQNAPQPQAPPAEPGARDAGGAPGQMSPQEAAALLDAEGGEEIGADATRKRLRDAVVAEPAEDW